MTPQCFDCFGGCPSHDNSPRIICTSILEKNSKKYSSDQSMSDAFQNLLHMPPGSPIGTESLNDELFGSSKPVYHDHLLCPWPYDEINDPDKSLIDLLCFHDLLRENSDSPTSPMDSLGSSSPFGSSSTDTDFLSESELLEYLKDTSTLPSDSQDDSIFLTNCANMNDVCSIKHSTTNTPITAQASAYTQKPTQSYSLRPSSSVRITAPPQITPAIVVKREIKQEPSEQTTFAVCGAPVYRPPPVNVVKSAKVHFIQPVMPITISNPPKSSQLARQVASRDNTRKRYYTFKAPSTYQQCDQKNSPPVLAKTEFSKVSLATANTRHHSFDDVCSKFRTMRKHGLRQLYFDRLRTIKDTNSASKSKRISLLLSSSSDDSSGDHYLSTTSDQPIPPPVVDVEAANDDHSYSATTSPVSSEFDGDENMGTDNESSDSSDDEDATTDAALKYRKSDVEDWTANPSKLINIGKQISKLSTLITSMKAPAPTEDISARQQTRKEKNRLASRACRLKKKARHEANKIKLRGLHMEQSRLKHYLIRAKAALAFPKTDESNGTDKLVHKIKMTLDDQVAGNLLTFIETVIRRTLETKKSDFQFQMDWLS